MTWFAILAVFAVCLYFGGMPFAAVWGTFAIILNRTSARPPEYLYAAAVSLFWLALGLGVEDRRLFFPFTMNLAAFATLLPGAGRRHRLWEGAVVVAAFTAVRILQSVAAPVLTVELIVAALILLVVPFVLRLFSEETGPRAGVAAFASLLALITIPL